MRIAATIMICGLLSAGSAYAQHGPKETTCNAFGPRARGLCIAYCSHCIRPDGSNCDDATTETGGCKRHDCAVLREMFTERTGRDTFPCEVTAATPTATTTASPTATFTPIFTMTATSTPEGTATETPPPTATETATAIATATFSPIATVTATSTPEGTATETPTGTPSDTPIPTSTFTPIFTVTATSTPEGTATETPTATATDVVVSTPTFTPIFTVTATSTAEGTATETPAPTATETAIFTVTATSTPEGAATETPTPALTETATQIATFTATSASAGFVEEVSLRTRTFVARLAGANEVPSVATDAQGSARLHLSAKTPALRYRVRVADIEGVTQAHIHCGLPGVNGPVVAFLFGPNPTGVTPGRVLASGSILPSEVLSVPDSAACPGGIASLTDLVARIRSGGAYVNVHTLTNPSGEIRGQIGLR